MLKDMCDEYRFLYAECYNSRGEKQRHARRLLRAHERKCSKCIDALKATLKRRKHSSTKKEIE